MALKNNLAVTKTADKAVTEYDSNGERIKLSPSIIRKYLVSGNGSITDQEAMMFLMLCKSQHLNPFLRDAYLIKYGDRNPASMVVGKDVPIKRARQQEDFSGFEAGIIVINQNGQFEERSGSFFMKDTEALVGGWAKVYVKGYEVPFYESVSVDEYMGRKADGSPNAQWTKMPGTMIRKVALVHALREAFPVALGGLYAQEEMSDVSGMNLDTAAVEVPDEAKATPEPEPDFYTDADFPSQETMIEDTPRRVAEALFDE